MIVIPAIDLKEGKCVRLEQGLMEKDTVYSDDPGAQARYWQEQGAELLHIVDLDGAFAGVPRNREAIQAIVAALDIPAWAHNEYGRALAQAGRTDAALTHFRAALAKDPENVQALFFLGLVLEGLGRIDEAVEHYCRSVSVEANPPADTRLRELGEVCD